jgi:hypothetical protein
VTTLAIDKATAARVEQHDESLSLTCMHGSLLLPWLSIDIDPGALFAPAGHTIEVPGGENVVDGVAIVAGDEVWAYYPHAVTNLYGPPILPGHDAICYTFTAAVDP